MNETKSPDGIFWIVAYMPCNTDGINTDVSSPFTLCGPSIAQTDSGLCNCHPVSLDP